MHKLIRLFFCLPIIAACFCHAQDMWNGHQQLLIVTTGDWQDKQGALVKYERIGDDSPWVFIEGPIPVVLGKSGLAWGIGLHPMPSNANPYKMEGDQKSPAGIFPLGSAFGFASEDQMGHLEIDYFQLNVNTEAVDDLLSQHYNMIVKSNEVIPDWHSSERMLFEPLYEIGMVINHNFPNPKKGAGSAIFFHIWRSEHSGTAGCTAMSQENLVSMLSWLNKDKNPLLVQLPVHEYDELMCEWDLPKLEK